MQRRPLVVIAALCISIRLAALAPAARAAELIVSAAASLSNAFTEIGRDFESQRPGVKVSLNFGASGALLQQIAKGAPADVLATADLETMDRAQGQSLIANDTRKSFARNRLVVVVPATGGPSVSRLDDLRRPEIARIGIGTPDSVPAGHYAKEALVAAHLWDVLTGKYVFGQNVRQVLDYVARAEVDAGFVYATDAELLKGKLKTALEVPTEEPVLYPIAVVQGTRQDKLARAFVDYVGSDAGFRVLAKYAFSRP